MADLAYISCFKKNKPNVYRLKRVWKKNLFFFGILANFVKSRCISKGMSLKKEIKMKELLEELQAVKTFADQADTAFKNSDLKDDQELSDYIEKLYDLAETCIEYIEEDISM